MGVGLGRDTHLWVTGFLNEVIDCLSSHQLLLHLDEQVNSINHCLYLSELESQKKLGITL